MVQEKMSSHNDFIILYIMNSMVASAGGVTTGQKHWNVIIAELQTNVYVICQAQTTLLNRY